MASGFDPQRMGSTLPGVSSKPHLSRKGQTRGGIDTTRTAFLLAMSLGTSG